MNGKSQLKYIAESSKYLLLDFGLDFRIRGKQNRDLTSSWQQITTFLTFNKQTPSNFNPVFNRSEPSGNRTKLNRIQFNPDSFTVSKLCYHNSIVGCWNLCTFAIRQ